MDIPWAALFFVTALFLLFKVFYKKEDDKAKRLEWEDGRRKARKAFKRDTQFYASFGVKSSEEYVRLSRGVEIFSKQWLPVDGHYKALVLYCHGYGDTCAYMFEDTAVRLAASNYAVVSMDYEGHGQSQGLHGFIRRFDTVVEDVAEVADTLKGREEFRALPYFLFGESMGGAVALKTHLFQPFAWDGALLLAPMCKIADDMCPSPVVIAILKLLARVVPTWKAVPTRDICSVAFRVPEKRMMASDSPSGYCCKPRIGTAYELLKATEDIGNSLHQVTLPLLILHGGADIVTDPAISRLLYEQARSTDKTFHLYPDSWHALINGETEDVVDKVLGDIIFWLDSRSASVGVMPAAAGPPCGPMGAPECSGTFSVSRVKQAALLQEEDAQSGVTTASRRW